MFPARYITARLGVVDIGRFQIGRDYHGGDIYVFTYLRDGEGKWGWDFYADS